MIDWNTANIDWQGRGWDRGLRGIEFDGDRIYIAASDELFVYSRDFEPLGSYRCPYLKHCHEINRHERRLYLTSTGFDAILGFDLDNGRFTWGLRVESDIEGYRAEPFDPNGNAGPMPQNNLHLNSVFCTSDGMYFAGLGTGALFRYDGETIAEWARVPLGCHNARPWRDGVLFNDTRANLVRYVTSRDQYAFDVPVYPPSRLTHTELDDSRIARQGFGRGLCTLPDGRVAAGSSPSTITLHDVDNVRTLTAITLTYDIRNAIHGLEVWPYD